MLAEGRGDTGRTAKNRERERERERGREKERKRERKQSKNYVLDGVNSALYGLIT